MTTLIFLVLHLVAFTLMRALLWLVLDWLFVFLVPSKRKVGRHEGGWVARGVLTLRIRASTIASLLLAGLSVPLGWHDISIIVPCAVLFGRYYRVAADLYCVARAPQERKQFLLWQLGEVEQGRYGISEKSVWSQEYFDFMRLLKLFPSQSAESFGFGPWCDYLRRRIAYLEELESEPTIEDRMARLLTDRSIVTHRLLDSVPPPATTAQGDAAKVPALASKLLLLVASRPDILVELEEEFYTIQGGKRVAQRWYWSQVLRSIPLQLLSRVRNAFVAPGSKPQ